MRIAYTCHDAFPSSDTNTHQIFWTVCESTKLGIDIELLTPPPRAARAATPVDLAAYYGARPEKLAPGFTTATLSHRPAERTLEKGSFDWSLPRLIRPRSPDLVWTRDPVAALSCLRAGLQVVFETYRPDLAVRRRFALWRRTCLAAPNLRGVITHSQLACDAFLAAGVPPNRCLVAHNGFAPSLMEPRMDRIQARTQLDLPIDVPLIVYAGHVGPEKGTEALVAMAARLPQTRVVIVGIDPHSSQAGWVDQVARRLGARNLLLRPRVRLAGVAPYLYAADCLIIPPTDEPLNTYGGTVLPLKVFTYLAAGRPIIAPRLPDIEEILTDGQTARLVTPDGGSSAAKALGDLLADRAAQEQLGKQALALSARYTWAQRARRIAEFLHGRPDLSQVPFSAIVGSSQPS